MERRIGPRAANLVAASVSVLLAATVFAPYLDGTVSLFYGFIAAPVALLAAAGFGLGLARWLRSATGVRATRGAPVVRLRAGRVRRSVGGLARESRVGNGDHHNRPGQFHVGRL